VGAAADVVASSLESLGVPHRRLSDRAWVVELRGERRHAIAVVLVLRERTLHLESFFMRRPAENHGAFYRLLLRANARLYGVRFAADEVGDVFLVGTLPLAALSEEELDRTLGSILEESDRLFMPAIEVGFASYLARDMAWRASQVRT
jgi:hypothetical protein